jgi:ATP-binding cassette subfamily B multidrug efflux pump
MPARRGGVKRCPYCQRHHSLYSVVHDFQTVAHLFEGWIDPFVRRSTYMPPNSTRKFLWHYVGQAKGAFAAMLALGGLVALLEAALFYFVGQLVDVLDVSEPSAGWDGLIGTARRWPSCSSWWSSRRFAVVTLAALVEEQAVVPGFFNLVRWQAYSHVSRQNLAFFQNDFAGRIVTKVWSAGQATGDFMVSLLQVVWFIMIYTVTTMALVAQLDWRLSALVLVWILIFGLLARFFVPRIRRYARASAEASAMLTGSASPTATPTSRRSSSMPATPTMTAISARGSTSSLPPSCRLHGI